MSEPLSTPDTLPADAAGLVARHGALPLPRLVEALRDDQARRWRAGRRLAAEAYLGAFPAVAGSAEDALVLIWGEVLLRLELGEAPQPAEYRARFPQHADSLAPLFDLQRHLGGDPSTTLLARDEPPGPARPGVPGYEILGELGRGGMGVVYKARQTSLNRVVALKMLLAGAYADPEQHRRLRAEAEAVAGLRHPNIVQIHEVGEHDGRPYLVLEYVEGGSLDGALAGAPQNPRAAAALVETLARAVQAAHQQGVIHRDLKPANVLLAAGGGAPSATPPAALVPKITDFGLAKQLDAGHGRTPSDAILGTPSYMAPEQASGKMRAVGPAADVYALGAILYEMLTGRPPFRGETPLDTLQQVLTDDPVPPRALQPKVPADLATACLKCLQKDAGRRYASAGDLAEDLRRFLAGEPIKARPVGPAARFYRWCRRKPMLAGLLALLVVGTAVSTWQAVRATLAERERDRQRVAAEEEAVRATAAERTAADNLREANENLALARQAVDDYSFKVSKDPRLSETNRPLRKELLQTVVPFYERLINRRADDPESRAQLAESCHHLARILTDIGEPKEAIARYQQARDVCARLVRDDPAEPGHQLKLAGACQNLGLLYVETGDYAAAESSLRECLTICEQLVEQFPERHRYQQELGGSHLNLGLLHLKSEKAGPAESEFKASLAILERLAAAEPRERAYVSLLANSHQNLGELFSGLGKYPQAEAAYQEASRFRKQLAESDPDSGAAQRELADTYAAQGRLYYETQKYGPAKESLRYAAGTYQRLAEKYPEVTSYQQRRAETNLTLGRVCLKTNRPEQAEAAFGAALEVFQKLASRHPTVVEYKNGLGTSYYNLAGVRLEAKQFPEASDLYGQAIRAYEEALQGGRQNAEARDQLPACYSMRARCRVALGQDRESVPDWDKALTLLGAGDNRDWVVRRRDWVRGQRAAALARGGDHAAAVPEAEALAQGKSANACYNLACVYALSSAATLRDDKLPPAEREKRSEEYAARVVPALRQAQAAGHFGKPETVERMKNDSDLASVHGRADFQQFLRALEKKTGP
jgi:tetratricopeptide (TPR) repeat protein/tRNA A-37 threonylcarbamoyl transferase component Bud32